MHVKSALFWDFMQCRMLVSYPHFGTSNWSQIQG